MKADSSDGVPEPILAAGGIILGTGKNDGKIALVLRRRYGSEIALPKGKLRKEETTVEAALREVEEETGCRVKIREYAGSTHYFVGSMPKIVFYFVMEAEAENSHGPVDTREIVGIDWESPQNAIAKLTHHEDRDLVSAVFAIERGRR